MSFYNGENSALGSTSFEGDDIDNDVSSSFDDDDDDSSVESQCKLSDLLKAKCSYIVPKEEEKDDEKREDEGCLRQQRVPPEVTASPGTGGSRTATINAHAPFDRKYPLSSKIKEEDDNSTMIENRTLLSTTGRFLKLPSPAKPLPKHVDSQQSRQCKKCEGVDLRKQQGRIDITTEKRDSSFPVKEEEKELEETDGTSKAIRSNNHQQKASIASLEHSFTAQNMNEEKNRNDDSNGRKSRKKMKKSDKKSKKSKKKRKEKKSKKKKKETRNADVSLSSSVSNQITQNQTLKEMTSAVLERKVSSIPSPVTSTTNTTSNNSYDQKWIEMFQHLENYQKQHGNCLVPSFYLENPQLGRWVSKQRYKIKTKKLKASRQHLLESIGFTQDSSVNPLLTNEEKWDVMFQELLKYKQQHKDCLVPSRNIKNEKLGIWLRVQRHNKNANKLRVDRQRRLESIGFIWDLKSNPTPRKYCEKKWDAMFEELEKYKREHGDCRVPAKYAENVTLGNWIQTQRRDMKDNKLSQSRKHRLESIGFVWSARENKSIDNHERKIKHDKSDKDYSKDGSIDMDDNHQQGGSNQDSDESMIKNKIINPSQQRVKMSFSCTSIKQEHDLGGDDDHDKRTDYAQENFQKEEEDEFSEGGECYKEDDYVDCANGTNTNDDYNLKKHDYNCEDFYNEKSDTDDINVGGKENFDDFGTGGDDKWDENDADVTNQSFSLLIADSDSSSNINEVNNSIEEDSKNDSNCENEKVDIYASKTKCRDKCSEDGKSKSENNSGSKNKHENKAKSDYDSDNDVLDIENEGEEEESDESNYVPKRKSTSLSSSPDDITINLNTKGETLPHLKEDVRSVTFSINLTPNSTPRNKLDQKWNAMFQDLENYKNQHGNCCVPKNYPKNPTLGRWVSRQRSNMKANKLSSHRQNCLDSIGFKWDLKPNPKSPKRAREKWDAMIQELHSGKWDEKEVIVNNQPSSLLITGSDNIRRINENNISNEGEDCKNDSNYENKKVDIYTSTPKREDRHNEDGESDSKDQNGNKDKINKDKSDYDGDKDIINSEDEDEENDGNSCEVEDESEGNDVGCNDGVEDGHQDHDDSNMKLKIDFKQENTSLSKNEKKWNNMFERLCSYRIEHGHCRVPIYYDEDQKLAGWVRQQREEMSKLRKAYDASSAAFTLLSGTVVKDQGVTEGGGVVVSPQGVVTVPGLGSLFPSKYLSLNRIQSLVSIDFQWSAKSRYEEWDDMFERLCAYKNEHGDCCVPFRYSKDRSLGQWVCRRRMEMRKLRRTYDALHTSSTSLPLDLALQNGSDEGVVLCSSSGVVTVLGLGSLIPSTTLSLDRIKRLVSIGFQWKSEKTQLDILKNWENMFERLFAYKRTHGDCLVPRRYQRDPKLGWWVSAQRSDMISLLKRSRLISRRKKKAKSQIESVVSHITSLGISVGKFSAEKLARLKSIGFQWNGRQKMSIDNSGRDGLSSVMVTDVPKRVTSAENANDGDVDDHSSLVASIQFNSASSFISGSSNSRSSESRKRRRDETTTDYDGNSFHQDGLKGEAKASYFPASKTPVSLPPPLKRWRKRKKMTAAATAAALTLHS